MSVSGGGVTEATISSLMPSTTYSIQVAAVNSAGIGVYSDLMIVQTESMSTHPRYVFLHRVTVHAGKIACTVISILHISTGVYLSLNDDIIPNHGYVEISDVGSTNDTALICHTNRPATTTSLGYFNSRGDWFGPNGMPIYSVGTDVPGFRRTRGPMMVRLLRNTATDPPFEGLYQCLVEDNTLTEQTVYVGLHNSGGGIN